MVGEIDIQNVQTPEALRENILSSICSDVVARSILVGEYFQHYDILYNSLRTSMRLFGKFVAPSRYFLWKLHSCLVLNSMRNQT